MMTTDQLIDLNISGASPDTSVMRYHEITRTDVWQVSLIGSFIGFVIIVVLAAVILIIGSLTDMQADEFKLIAMSVGIPILMGVLILAVIVIPTARLKREAREGYLKIDENKIEYWTRRGLRSIPIDRVFAAGDTKNGWGFDVLRIYFLEGNVRWFAHADKTFKSYEPVAGPAMKVAYGSENGNEIARNAIIYHYNNRAKKGMGIATVPAYQFKSVQMRRENIIFGEMVEIAKFECDGTTVIYSEKNNRFEIPVHTVKKANVIKVQSKYGVTKWTVTLDLDLSSGYEKLVVDIRDLPNAQEIENYLRCLPFLFPEPKDDGYWS